MTERDRTAEALPAAPGRTIIRSAEASAWVDGFQFLEAANRTAGEIAERERARGYADGWADGAAQATRLVVETTAQVDVWLTAIEGEVLELSLDIVRQVLGNFDRSDLVARVAQNALTAFRQAKYVSLVVHPDVADGVRNRLATENRAADRESTVSVVADPKLDPDRCVLRSEFATIDAGLEAQLGTISKALNEALQERLAKS